MGLSGISMTSLLLILLIVILLFGTKKLRHIGKDLGASMRSFRKGLEGEDEAEKTKTEKNESSKSDA